MDSPPAEMIGRFEILRRLGEGAFGRVYLARDTKAQNPQEDLVAIKLPHPQVFRDMGMQMRFLRELQTLSSLVHPGVCRFLETGMHQRSLFVVLEYVAGESLSSRLKQGTGFTLRSAVELVRDLALILADIHEQGVVHRDLKPSNIMLRTDGRPVVMDFGLARGDRSQELRLTNTGQILGTPYYMSPEVIAGYAAHAGPATDVYSLGVILFEMLTGRRPFSGPTRLLLQIVPTQPPPAPSAVSNGLAPELDTICLTALAKEPAQRYEGSMRQFAAALQSFLDGPHLQDGHLNSRIPQAEVLVPTTIECLDSRPKTQSRTGISEGVEEEH